MVLKQSEFIHLHLHSQYSLLDGAIHFKPLLKKVASLGMSAVGVTDHGAMFGAVEFFYEAIKAGIKPIIGCEVYVAPASRFDRTPISSQPGSDRANHLVLLAVDQRGYKNLCVLVSAGYTEGFYYKPRVDRELLESHSEGLIALSACLKGEVASHLIHDRDDMAEQSAGFYREIFPGRFYLEIQDHGLSAQKKVNRKMIPLAKKMNLPLVATNDAHYLDQEDAEAHDALLCIGTGKSIKEPNRLRYEGDQFFVKSADQMKALFREVPEAIRNTLVIAEAANFRFEEGKYHLPSFPNIPKDTTASLHLEELAVRGLERRFMEGDGKGERFDDETRGEYLERLKSEIAVIKQMGFAGYFLITEDFIRRAREMEIPVGPGRGSAAGSMVAYALKITELDPIKYGLIFERFLNPERISMPDIDIDFCMDRRGEVIDYVRETYGGADHVTQIITFGAMKAKAVVRDVARVMDMPYSQADKIAKLIPNDLGMTIARALKDEPRLAKMEQEDPDVARLLKISRALEGTARHASTHAAGVVISPQPLTNFMPVFMPAGSGDITTQYQMKDVERLGMLKMDFLGLRTLTVMHNTARLILANHDPQFDLSSIPLDDPKTYKLLCSADTLGVFQLESTGMRDLIRKMKPSLFQDIIALVALFRPGPIQSGMADQYVKRKHELEKVRFEFKELKPILGETYGVPVYQEQVMKIANALAGFSLGQADSLRKAMGKKNMNIMAEVRDQFIDGAMAKGFGKAKIEKQWNQLEKFGEYGFNKSHSACYALVAYQTAYLKAHYTPEYMSALISSDVDNTDKVIRYIQELRDKGIALEPPDMNESMIDFTVSKGAIRFGLGAIKGIGTAVAQAIARAREKKGKFTSMLDAAESVEGPSLNKRALEALIKCGAFDFTGHARAALFDSIEATLSAAGKTQRDRETGQVDIFSALGGSEGSGAVRVKDTPEWEEKERLAREKEALGFYISGHPLNEYAMVLRRLANFNTSTLENARHRGEVRIGGMVIMKKIKTIKNGERMAYLTIEDMHGSVEALVWPDVYKKYIDVIESEEPIFIRGTADVDEEKGVKVITQEVMTIPSAREKFTNAVKVSFSTPGLSAQTLLELKKICADHRGNCEVLLDFRAPGKAGVTMRSGNLKVTASEELISRVEQLVGEENVRME